ncbi:iron-sulfur cluster co-chaperone protein HscB isoform X2 [Cyclopterus lumpus]|uniref:Iron-sulfur cluster co-chaperone protein HscB n=1 Tax=Cyclopterus lumpus TaxID=8103 RepID=A0A8C3AGX5_CYCLU|nr:iron-sulfur cluster co-chaperone protein HscB isoform X2 [Cyclopterus lumpus]
MLPLNTLRVLCSPRALLHRSWLTTTRQCVYKTVTRRTSTCGPKEDTWHGNKDPKALGKERRRIYSPNPGSSNRSYCAGQVQLNCWSCKQPLDATSPFFCTSCNVIQSPEEDASYFKIMDCDVTFTLDTHKLQKRYLQLQRSLHPDNFSQKSGKEQQYSESHSALVNKAYRTLLKPLSRGLYMLELEGVRTDEGTDSGADSGFLMELMEINEAVDEARTPEDANKIGRDMKGKLAVLTEAIDAALLEGELQAAKALLAQMKYYANIEEKVKEKLSEFM